MRSFSRIYYWIIATLVSLAFISLSGEAPLSVLAVLFKSAFGSMYDFGTSLFYVTPLLMSGLSVAIAYRAGLFNIGAEGQLIVGSFAAMVVGVESGDYFGILSIPIVLLVAFVAGGVWGWFAGWIKAQRGGHEVISTIMLNFVAAGLVSYFVIYHYKNPASQNPESLALAQNFRLNALSQFDGAPVNILLIISLVLCVFSFLFFRFFRMGFEIDVVGASPKVAQYSGINVKGRWKMAMFIAGGFGGLAGLGDLLGSSGRYVLDSSPGYGFMGIAVALLAKGRPLAIIFAALFFGILHKGAADLDFEFEKITRDLSFVIQAIFILFVSANRQLKWIRRPASKSEFVRSKAGESNV